MFWRAGQRFAPVSPRLNNIPDPMSREMLEFFRDMDLQFRWLLLIDYRFTEGV
jgi:hypothetical protein